MSIQVPELSDVEFLNRNTPAHLTRFEEAILRLLQAKEGWLVTHSEIQTALLPLRGGKVANSNSEEVLIRRLRRKGYSIRAKRGRGYTLVSSIKELNQ